MSEPNFATFYNSKYWTRLEGRDQWEEALHRLFRSFTPIVIGYGGNDKSLMQFLDNLEPEEVEGGIFWCYRNEDGPPNERIRRLVSKHKGRLVPIPGFDQLMFFLAQGLNFKPLDSRIEKEAKERADKYREDYQKFSKTSDDNTDDQSVGTALNEISQREDNWWSWDMKARAESNPEKREAIYRQGIKAFPENASLISNFANFLADKGKDEDEIERLYQNAIELEPDHAINLANYALFMTNIRKEHNEAERLFKKAIEIDPDHANRLGNFATFMISVRKEHDEAERLYRKAIELEPDHTNHLGNLANFMTSIRKKYDEAESLYRKAIEIDAHHVTNLGNFALFMTNIRKEHDEAERLYRKAIELEPINANILGNFATFMTKVRKDHNEAERLYRKAIELEPINVNILGSFANFMTDIRKNHEEAEKLYRNAIEIEPDNVSSIGNFAIFMTNIRKNHEEAERLYRNAIEIEPDKVNTLGNFVSILVSQGKLAEAKKVLVKAMQLEKQLLIQVTAEIFLYYYVVAFLEKLDTSNSLGRLKFIVDVGYERIPWTFENLLESIRDNVDDHTFAFLTALADAILDETKVEALNEFPEWRDIEPIELDEPWDIEADLGMK